MNEYLLSLNQTFWQYIKSSLLQYSVTTLST